MKGQIFSAETHGRKLSVYLPRTEERCACCYLLCGDCEQTLMPALAGGLDRLHRPLALLSLEGVQWDRDYTPWPAQGPAERVFSGGAPMFLRALVGEIIPWAEAELPVLTGRAHRGLAGYSLGGLTALYGGLETGAFAQLASVSGSLWYPGWLDYLQERLDALPMPLKAYCSLGKAEARTRFGPMAACAASTRRTVELLKTRLGETGACFEWNNGPHFFEVEERMLKALRCMSL